VREEGFMPGCRKGLHGSGSEMGIAVEGKLYFFCVDRIECGNDGVSGVGKSRGWEVSWRVAVFGWALE
jgi:hypothetical protein